MRLRYLTRATLLDYGLGLESYALRPPFNLSPDTLPVLAPTSGFSAFGPPTPQGKPVWKTLFLKTKHPFEGYAFGYPVFFYCRILRV